MSWVKFLKYGLPVLLIIGVIATGYFMVQKYNATLTKNTELTDQVKDLQDEITSLEEHQQGVSDAVDQGYTQTTQIIERTREVERQIHALPETQDCVNSPSVGHAIGVLRGRREQAPDEGELP